MSSGVGHLRYLINTRNEDSIYSISDFFLIYPYRPMLKLCPVVAAILDFRLTQKNTHFVKDHSMNRPAIFVVK